MIQLRVGHRHRCLDGEFVIAQHGEDETREPTAPPRPTLIEQLLDLLEVAIAPLALAKKGPTGVEHRDARRPECHWKDPPA